MKVIAGFLEERSDWEGIPDSCDIQEFSDYTHPTIAATIPICWALSWKFTWSTHVIDGIIIIYFLNLLERWCIFYMVLQTVCLLKIRDSGALIVHINSLHLQTLEYNINKCQGNSPSNHSPRMVISLSFFLLALSFSNEEISNADKSWSYSSLNFHR